MKVAIAYDWVNQIGGAERVLQTLHQIWPKAPLFTSVYDSKKAAWAKEFPLVKTSFLQSIPGTKKYYRFFAPLIPIGFEQFNFDDFDLVISVTSGPAKAIVTKPQTCHICYCLTPPRYFWERRFLDKKWLFPLLAPLRKQDYFFSKRPDYFLATSENVSKKIEKFYGIKSEVIYPGADLTKFKPRKDKVNKKERPFFLVVSRLVEYKKTDLVIKAFNQLGWRLKIIGSGRQFNYLKEIANENITFLNKIDDKQLIEEYQNCQALIAAQEEDFGLTSIEVQACGKPVIGLAKGGIKETVVPGLTGELFYPQTKKALIKVLRKFDLDKYKEKDCLKNAQGFSLEKFMLSFKNKIEARYKEYRE